MMRVKNSFVYTCISSETFTLSNLKRANFDCEKDRPRKFLFKVEINFEFMFG